MTDIDSPDIILKNIKQLITMAPEGIDKSRPRCGQDMRELGIVEDGAIAVNNGRIISIGTTKKVLNEVDISNNTKVLDVSFGIVIPGFVDPHTHLIFSGTRETELTMKLEGKTYMEILQSGGGILKTVRATRNASVDDLVSEAKRRLDIMLEHGTTTVEAKSGYGLKLDSEINSLIAIKHLNEIHPVDLVPTFLGAHAIPPEFSDRPDDYIDLVISEMLPEVVNQKLAEFCDIFCEKGVFNIEQSKRLLSSAERLGLKLKLHVDEFVPLGGAELAAELNACSADHLAMSTDKGLNALAEAGVIGVLLPGTPFAIMENHYPDARKMIELKVPLALATDLNPNCLTESMQFIISLACYNMKMLPAEAITAATINAAFAVNRQDEVGSLEPSKKGDLTIFNVPNYHHIPYHFGINHVNTVLKNGEIVINRS
jgi:imidazolonepropionase